VAALDQLHLSRSIGLRVDADIVIKSATSDRIQEWAMRVTAGTKLISTISLLEVSPCCLPLSLWFLRSGKPRQSWGRCFRRCASIAIVGGTGAGTPDD
jgi:hypothetical protein